MTSAWLSVNNTTVSRNALCPCGSGKRFKDCHGALKWAPEARAGEIARVGSAVGPNTVAVPIPPADPVVDAALEEARTARADGDLARAQRLWHQVLAADPDNPEANFHVGNLHRERGETGAAIECYGRALRVAPANASLLNNLGLAHEAAGDSDRALECYRRALAVDSSYPDALGNMANVLFQKHDFSASAEAYAHLFAIRRELPVAVVVRRAAALQAAGRLQEAEACFLEAARREPDDARIICKLGTFYVDTLRYDDAEKPLSRMRELDPTNGFALSLLAHSRAHRCAWSGIDELFGDIARLIESPPTIYWAMAQLQLLTMPLSPLALRRAAAQCGSVFGASPAPERPPSSPSPDGRLRVGFASSDFRLHPVASIISELLERLDRSRFEIFAYGLLPADPGPIGQRIAAAVDHFVDLSACPTPEAVRRIRQDGVSILLDLNGYTASNRPELFAHRPAPLQVNALGFSGTLGVDWYDYILVDPFVARDGTQEHFAERFLHMPHSLYPSDTTRAARQPQPTRADYHLAADAFVLCSQAPSYKIVPPVFDVWMRLLNSIPGSVLWLRPMLASAQANLRAEAVRRSVAPERLVFAPFEANLTYLARYALADLYLDTHPFGSHTTVNDALFSGLPVVTLAGETFASRVSGSQLHAVGLPELAVSTLADYEAAALALARDRQRLAGLRVRLAQNRSSYPLFDMARYARDFEDGLLRTWTDYAAALSATCR